MVSQARPKYESPPPSPYAIIKFHWSENLDELQFQLHMLNFEIWRRNREGDVEYLRRSLAERRRYDLQVRIAKLVLTASPEEMALAQLRRVCRRNKVRYWEAQMRFEEEHGRIDKAPAKTIDAFTKMIATEPARSDWTAPRNPPWTVVDAFAARRPPSRPSFPNLNDEYFTR